MRPGDHDAVLPAEHERAEGRGEAHLAEAALSHGGCLRILAANDVADDHEIRPRPIEILRGVWRHRVDPPRAEHVAHRRIDVGVAAGDLVAGGLEHPRKRPHARPRHADEMDAAHGLWIDVGENEAVVSGHAE